MGKFLFYTGGILLFIFGLLFLDKLILGWMEAIEVPQIVTLMKVISFIGKGYSLFIITTLLYFLAKKRRALYTNAGIFAIVTVIVYLLKLIVNRGRPDSILITETDASFPSGHATYMFGALPLLDLEFVRDSWIFVTFAVLDLFSRLYLRAHYFSDVVFGILLGYTIALVAMHIERTIITTKIQM